MFKTGMIVCTKGIASHMKDYGFNKFIDNCLLNRYINEDFGDLDPHDKAVNEDALQNGERIFASYHLPAELQTETDDKIWIITEWDRSVTTILFPSEY